MKAAPFIVTLALLAGCSGGTPAAPPIAGGAGAQTRYAAPLSAAESVLYSFTGAASDGSGPYGSPIADSSGNLYGTTGTSLSGTGVVWKLTASGKTYKESAIYKFAAKGTTGAFPQAGLIVDSSGNLYGTTAGGGKGSCSNLGVSGCGVIFELTPSKGGYTEKVLHYFGSSKGDGTFPAAALVASKTGALYGTTEYGGDGKCTQGPLPGCGTVFRIFASGKGYVTAYSFAGGKDGMFPATSLVLGKNGLYGTTNNGGGSTSCPNGCGTVFTLLSVSSAYSETVLYRFQGGKDGEIPGDRGRGLYVSPKNVVVGTTQVGGTGPCGIGFFGGCGTVFELIPKGGKYAKTTLYDFQGQGSSSTDGEFPQEALVADTSGTLYGLTLAGGGSTACSVGCGVVFALTPSKTGYTEKVIYILQGGKDAANPFDGVTMDKSGALLGTSNVGGKGSCSHGCGTVFTVTP